eukprot:2437744-Rhodomonas_salina.2
MPATPIQSLEILPSTWNVQSVTFEPLSNECSVEVSFKKTNQLTIIIHTRAQNATGQLTISFTGTPQKTLHMSTILPQGSPIDVPKQTYEIKDKAYGVTSTFRMTLDIPPYDKADRFMLSNKVNIWTKTAQAMYEVVVQKAAPAPQQQEGGETQQELGKRKKPAEC